MLIISATGERLLCIFCLRICVTDCYPCFHDLPGFVTPIRVCKSAYSLASVADSLTGVTTDDVLCHSLSSVLRAINPVEYSGA